MRKLNRERETELNKRLMTAYRNLLRISININSRSNVASLIYEGERRLREMLGIQHVVILVIDHEHQMFMKLITDSTESHNDEKLGVSHILQLTN